MQDTKQNAMLVKDMVQENALILLHAASGDGKSGYGFDLIGSILKQQAFMDKFDILATNVMVFFISQDAFKGDVQQQSWKILRKCFDAKNKTHRRLLNLRFHIIDQQDINLSKGRDDEEALIEAIRTKRDASLAELYAVPSFKTIDKEAAQRAQAALAMSALDGFAEPEVGFSDEETDEMKVLIVWDSMRQFRDGKESQSDDLAPVIKKLRRVNLDLGATSILYHHDNRGGNYRGDGSIIAGVDQEYHIVPAEKSDEQTDPIRTMHFKVPKPRGITLKPFVYRMVRENVDTPDEVIKFEYVRPLVKHERQPRTRARKERPVIAMDPAEAAARRLYAEGSTVRGLVIDMKTAGFKVSRDRASKLIKEIKAEHALGIKGNGGIAHLRAPIRMIHSRRTAKSQVMRMQASERNAS